MALDGGALLVRVERAGRREFPTVKLASADLLSFLGSRELPPELDDERAAEVYLACACARLDSSAIALLRERYLLRVQASLGRRRSPALVEEAMQQLLATIFVPRVGKDPEIGDFTGFGPLGAWLRIVGLRILLHLERKDKRIGEIHRAAHSVPAPEDPEIAFLRRRYGEALQDALMEAWKTMGAETRVLLRLRYNDGRSIDDIASVEKVHRATAARRVRKAEESLIDETRRVLTLRLGASEPEVHSVLRLIRSQLHLSARQIFREPTA